MTGHVNLRSEKRLELSAVSSPSEGRMTREMDCGANLIIIIAVFASFAVFILLC